VTTFSPSIWMEVTVSSLWNRNKW